jgi:hypothetical protein
VFVLDVGSRDGINCPEKTISAGSRFSRVRSLTGSCRYFRPKREFRTITRSGVAPDPYPKSGIPQHAATVGFYWCPLCFPAMKPASQSQKTEKPVKTLEFYRILQKAGGFTRVPGRHSPQPGPRGHLPGHEQNNGSAHRRRVAIRKNDKKDPKMSNFINNGIRCRKTHTSITLKPWLVSPNFGRIHQKGRAAYAYCCWTHAARRPAGPNPPQAYTRNSALVSSPLAVPAPDAAGAQNQAPPLDGCPMFAPAYMGRKRRGAAPPNASVARAKTRGEKQEPLPME